MTTWKEIMKSAPPAPHYVFSRTYWLASFFVISAISEKIPMFKEEKNALEVMDYYYNLSGDLHLVIAPENDLYECLWAVYWDMCNITGDSHRRCLCDKERREIILPGLLGDLNDVVHDVVPWCRVSDAYLVDVDDEHVTPISKADIDRWDDACECHEMLGTLRVTEAQIVHAGTRPDEWEAIMASRDESMLFDLWYSLRTPASDYLKEGALERWHMTLSEAEDFLTGKGY